MEANKINLNGKSYYQMSLVNGGEVLLDEQSYNVCTGGSVYRNDNIHDNNTPVSFHQTIYFDIEG